MRNDLKRFLSRPLIIGSLYLVLIPVFGIIYYFFPSFWKDPLTFIQSLYFSIVTITTLGYGDISPQTELARIIVAIEALFGVVTIGSFLNAVARRGEEERELRRKNVIKSHLLVQYKEWREDLLSVCLCGAADGYGFDYGLEIELANFRRFREYFSGENNQRWYDVLNGLQSNEQFLEDIFVVSDLFSQQINHALGAIQAEDAESIAILTRVAQRPCLLKRLDVYSADPVKYIGSYLYEIMAMWSTTRGYLDEDFIESAIRKL